MDKLKPCPFCGGEARTGFAINDYNRWGVECTRCGATVEVADWCGDYDTEENAIKAWNRRASEASNEVIAKSKPKWISVKERLPENDSHDRFLVCAIDPWFGTKVIDFMRYDRRWLYDGKPTEAKVTHWMPLPSTEGLNET